MHKRSEEPRPLTNYSARSAADGLGAVSGCEPQISDAVRSSPDPVRVLTDLVDPFNTVVIETQLESLAAPERRKQQYRSDEQLRNKMGGYTDLYAGGRGETYLVVD